MRVVLFPEVDVEEVVTPRNHLSFRERADERLDEVRMVRDERFAYPKNYMPYAPAGQHLASSGLNLQWIEPPVVTPGKNDELPPFGRSDPAGRHQSASVGQAMCVAQPNRGIP
ncbi:hypothetical protein [Novipirellula artificiosorum]|uniref:hypothetical protein n=1 Tax=Novipirellula artificiosorum TaxID=2528016 RepID=UPI0011B50805|nr:hypothetical protein [Novipirellula artificiosorum]